jgi:hypothetical protein
MRAEVLTKMNIGIAVFGNVMPCSLVEFIDVLEDLVCLVFYPEDGRRRFLRNAEKFPPDYKVSELSFTVPLHADSMKLRLCEATFPQLVKRILYLTFDGLRSIITVFATVSHLSDGSTYVYVFQALCFPSGTGPQLCLNFSLLP